MFSGKTLSKKILRNKKALFVFFFITGLVLSLGLYQKIGRSQEKTSEDSIIRVPEAYKDEAAKWESNIDNFGAQEAYEKFKEEFSNSHYAIQHEMAHVFGSLLYEKVGLSGVGVCDDSFAYGCYHSFFAKAMSEKGLGIAVTLDQECVKKWGDKALPCAHGIGHSLLVTLGEGQLVRALEVCASLTWKGPTGGCSSGVFMEYNHKTVHALSEAQTRELDPVNPYAPCSDIPEKFRQSCYFEQAEWWRVVYNNNFNKIGSLCQGIENAPEQEACFTGVGNYLVAAGNFSADNTITSCESMPSAAASDTCLKGSIISFVTYPDGSNKAKQICEALSTISGKESCFKELENNPFFEG